MSDESSVNRRGFLKLAATGAAGLVAAPAAVEAQVNQSSAKTAAAESKEPHDPEVMFTEHPGSDFMVDVFKSLDIEYICANPGSSFRALHESIVNYGGNTKPEFITCMPRRIVGRHGARLREDRRQAAGACCAHGTVGLQHAAMAHLQRVLRSRAGVHGRSATRSTRRCGGPASSGRTACRTRRRWSATSSSGTTRRCRCTHFAESAVRAYKIAMTPPMVPVVIVADSELQERPIADTGAAARAEADARRRRRRATPAPSPRRRGCSSRAENPVLVADRAGPHAGRDDAARRAGRDAAGAGRRSGRPDEFPDAPSAESDRASRGARRRGGRDRRPRADRFLGRRQRVPRSAAPHVPAASPSRARS